MIKIYVINLITQKDRRNRILSEAKNLELVLNIENAVIGSEIDSSFINKFQLESKNKIERKLSPGEIGCYLSHINCLKKFLSTQDEYAIILEDDVKIDSKLADFIKSIKRNMSRPFFDVLLLGYRNGYGSFWGGAIWYSNKLIRFVDCGYGAHAYLISRQGAEKILKYNIEPIWPYDYVTGGKADSRIRVYGLKEKIIELDAENSSNSSLESERNKLGASSVNLDTKSFNLFKSAKRFIKGLKPIKAYK